MNEHFDGFLPGKQPTFTLPSAFIAELLPLIDDLAELKVTLYFMWAIQQREGRTRYLRRQDFLKDGDFMAGLAGMDFEPGATLDAALDRACARGTLLRADVRLAGAVEPLYFINTELGRAGVEQIRAGGWMPGLGDAPVEIMPERPNIYRLYELNIGPLTPLIADSLKDAEKEYPAGWIEEAMLVAVESNARNWRYIRAVLDRWQREGKQQHEVHERPDEQDGRRFITGKYADFIEH